MNKTKADLPLILSDYEQFVIQQERRRQQVRDWYAKWEETRSENADLQAIAKWGRSSSWNISDRD